LEKLYKVTCNQGNRPRDLAAYQADTFYYPDTGGEAGQTPGSETAGGGKRDFELAA
jgi:hypothetical protein